jgi:hypothetical protein
MLGHVEYKQLDEFGNIKAYLQNDNEVVVAGKDCAASFLFTDGTTKFATSDCIDNPTPFTYVGVGNGTIDIADLPAIGATNATLQNTAGGTSGKTSNCADNGTGLGDPAGGDMARRNVTAQITSAGTTTIVILDTSFGTSAPFTFDAFNATDVTDSGLFNDDYGTPDAATHTCGNSGTPGSAGTNWNMFSRQLLNDDSGITVSDGDSLSVKWTITVG